MNPRILTIQDYLKTHRIDALLVSQETNVSYLAQHLSSESWMLITKNKAIYLTDFRYLYEVQKRLKNIEIICCQKSLYDTLLECIKRNKIKSLGYSPNGLTVSQFSKLKGKTGKYVKLIKVEGAIESLRQGKDSGELKTIRAALAIHRRAHQYLKRIVRPGITEREVLLKLEYFVKSMGAGFSFDPIIASGPNSCYPHAKVTDRKIRNNEPVLIDMGVDVRGYKSDLTRMFFLGKISELVLDVQRHVKEAQQQAIKMIKAGERVSVVDDQARNYLKKKKLDSYFGHALGHGVGLDIHEAPRISGNNKNLLVENMVITVEPAVYLPGKFGIRIEDMVLVTKKGCKILSDDIH